jgi:predicted DNA-binding protein (MmcQ/YjbR family)
MKNLIIAVALCLGLFAGNLCAQKNKNTVTFSSEYSNLSGDCKTLKGGEGQDDASDCKGVGGYRIRISPTAASIFVSAETPDKKDSIQIAAQDFDFDRKDRKIEWRMADGKVFAVIMRVNAYAAPPEDLYYGEKTGEKLVVKGLKGFEYIDFEVDAKTADADVKARRMAEAAYMKKQKITINLKL